MARYIKKFLKKTHQPLPTGSDSDADQETVGEMAAAFIVGSF